MVYGSIRVIAGIGMNDIALRLKCLPFCHMQTVSRANFSSFTKKTPNDRIPLGVFCSEGTKGGSVYGKSVSAIISADSPQKRKA